MRRLSINLVMAVAMSVATVGAARADVSVPGLFSDHVVLQRDIPLPVWGTASPNEPVTIRLGDRKASTTADAAGNWRVRLDPLAAGGPFEMTLAGNNTITLKDVYVGEVWLCSGQSNMAFRVNKASNGEQEVALANHPSIRLFTVPRIMAMEPQATVNGSWEVCSPKTAGTFSAVGYFFGRELQQTLNVHIGLIDSSWGGTPAESWTARSALEAEPDFKPIFKRWEKKISQYKPPNEPNVKKPAKTRKKTKRAGARKRAASRPATRRATRRRPIDPRTSPQRPCVLYNGMIHPLMPYAIRGAIWYQGEGNAPRAYQYRKLLPTMIRNWQAGWGQGDFPFLIVQLANFQMRQKQPHVSDWAELREAQLMTLSLPNTGLAVTIDIGNPKDIHPTNKQEVGRRLALAARATVYGQKIPYSGPMYDSMKIEGGKIRILFKHTDGGLKAKGGALKGFGIAGRDQKFVDAEAVIDGDTVIVSSRQVAEPVAVRYAWADAPECNLYNGADLPASPFRTDDWPGITAQAK